MDLSVARLAACLCYGRQALHEQAGRQVDRMDMDIFSQSLICQQSLICHIAFRY